MSINKKQGSIKQEQNVGLKKWKIIWKNGNICLNKSIKNVLKLVHNKR